VRHLNIYLFYKERGYDHERALDVTNRNWYSKKVGSRRSY
jgi:hypothetical protein